MHEAVGLIHSTTHVLFGLYQREIRISEHIGITPAGGKAGLLLQGII
jgi:hypothetical protein